MSQNNTHRKLIEDDLERYINYGLAFKLNRLVSFIHPFNHASSDDWDNANHTQLKEWHENAVVQDEFCNMLGLAISVEMDNLTKIINTIWGDKKDYRTRKPIDWASGEGFRITKYLNSPNNRPTKNGNRIIGNQNMTDY